MKQITIDEVEEYLVVSLYPLEMVARIVAGLFVVLVIFCFLVVVVASPLLYPLGLLMKKMGFQTKILDRTLRRDREDRTV